MSLNEQITKTDAAIKKDKGWGNEDLILANQREIMIALIQNKLYSSSV